MLTKIKGKGAGTIQTPITQKAYANAKKRGKLKDWRLSSEIEDIEVIDIESQKTTQTPKPEPTPEQEETQETNEETPSEDAPSDGEVNDDEDFDGQVGDENEEPFYTQESLEELTKKEIEVVIVSMKDKGIGVPAKQVKKQVLIDLVLDNQ